MSSIINAIEEKLGTLSQKERNLAVSIIEHPHEVVRLNITDLARMSETSAATVSRFCKNFHFQNFADFKMKLASELTQTPAHPASYQDIVAGNSLQNIISGVRDNHLRSITETTLHLDPDTLQQALDALLRARQIDLYGISGSGIAARDFYLKLVRIGKRAAIFTDPHMQITSASTLTEQDVAFVISYSGETPEVIDALVCAKDRGAATISLTKYGANKLSGIADIALFNSSLEEGIRRGDMASRIAQLYVIDILFTGMLSGQFEQFVPRLEDSFQMVQLYRKSTKGR